jgi:MFS family permease
MKETQPLRFFGAFAVAFLVASMVLMAPVLVEYTETGLVPRMPTWVLSVALLLLSVLAMVSGLILDSVSQGRAEQKRIFYLSMPAGGISRQERPLSGAAPGKTPRAA